MKAPLLDKGVKVSLNPSFELEDPVRAPVAVALGFHVHGVCQPIPDQHGETTLIGALARICPRIEDPSEELLTKFATFVDKYIEDKIIGLPDHIEPCGYEYINSLTGKSQARRDELTVAWTRYLEFGFDRDAHYCKSFQKAEFYTDVKFSRGINSKSDQWKVYLGRYAKLLEAQVFDSPHFIKKVPIALRSEYILNMFSASDPTVRESDFSSMEGSYTQAFMSACEMRLWRKFVTNTKVLEVIYRRLCGKNVLKFKHFTIEVLAKRMSGGVETSVMNGFTNLMLNLFLVELLGGDISRVSIVVEGDDGLIQHPYTYADVEHFAALGFRAKLIQHESTYVASFCGIVTGERGSSTLTDPVDFMATIGWASMRHVNLGNNMKLKLLKMKALSAAHQYNGCPVVSKLAFTILRLTEKVNESRALKARLMCQWELDQLAEARASKLIEREPTMSERLTVEVKWGIMIEKQYELERYFDTLTEVCELRVDVEFPLSWRNHWDQYVFTAKRGEWPVMPTLVHPLYKPYYQLDGKGVVTNA